MTSIHLQGLVKTYGATRAVDGVDLAVETGEIVALLGPNGAGKSTTIDMLLGLARPDAGAVAIGQRPPREAIAAGAVGVMLQTGSLIPDLTVRELVGMMAALYPDPLPVDEALAHVGIEPLAERRTQRLSGGESQRVRFAPALDVHRHGRLVEDEQPRVGDEREREADALALAAGELLGPAAGDVGDADQVEQIGRAHV